MISVVIPVYNAESLLSRCLESLQRQTIFSDLEIIIVNDGSVDGSKNIIDDFAEKCINVKVFHIQNQGVSNARNIGIENAIGEYIAFIDADDYVENNHFEIMLKEMDSQCDIVCCGYIVEYEKFSVMHNARERHVLNKIESIKNFLNTEWIDPNVWNKLFRRSVIGNNRFNTNLTRGEDKCFVFDCLCNSESVKILPYTKYHYVMNGASVMHGKLPIYNEDRFMFVPKYILQQVREKYPEIKNYAECAYIDSACRMYGDIYRANSIKEYQVAFDELRSDIKKFSLIKKLRYSNRKHTLALLAAKISPKVYVWLKYGMKLQYTK